MGVFSPVVEVVGESDGRRRLKALSVTVSRLLPDDKLRPWAPTTPLLVL